MSTDAHGICMALLLGVFASLMTAAFCFDSVKDDCDTFGKVKFHHSVYACTKERGGK